MGAAEKTRHTKAITEHYLEIWGKVRAAGWNPNLLWNKVAVFYKAACPSQGMREDPEFVELTQAAVSHLDDPIREVVTDYYEKGKNASKGAKRLRTGRREYTQLLRQGEKGVEMYLIGIGFIG